MKKEFLVLLLIISTTVLAQQKKYTIVWENGETPISKSDIEAKLTEAQNELEAEVQSKIDNKASGKQKLKDLGLDDDEIKALIGA